MKSWFRPDRLEYEFLPPALEIEHTPPPPLGRFIIWTIFIVVVAVIAWSVLGKVDEVAVATGKVVHYGNVKIVQPMQEGVIKAIHVTEGQRVSAGQLLLELDSTMSQADVESLKKRLMLLKVEKGAIEEEVYGTSFDVDELKAGMPGMEDEIDRACSLQFDVRDTREAEYEAHLNTLRTALVQKQNAQASAEGALPLYEQQLDLVEKETEVTSTLTQAGALSEMDLVSQKKELNDAEVKLKEQQALVQSARDSVEQAKADLDYAEKERNQQLLTIIQNDEKQITELEAELTKAAKTMEMENLTAPVSGTVHGLASHTIGGVLTPAQQVITIVPEGTKLVIEAYALNKDIGFIKVGQPAEVKLDTFPFQKYGTLKGTVTFISPDAIEDEKRGTVYKLMVELETDHLEVNGRDEYIAPGMTASVEVKTGQRRIIEFFLSPLIKYARESLILR